VSRQDIPFGAGKHAQLLAGGNDRAAAELVAEHGLAAPGEGRPVIVVSGGASGLKRRALERPDDD
jgi:hypothetical protein